MKYLKDNIVLAYVAFQNNTTEVKILFIDIFGFVCCENTGHNAQLRNKTCAGLSRTLWGMLNIVSHTFVSSRIVDFIRTSRYSFVLEYVLETPSIGLTCMMENIFPIIWPLRKLILVIFLHRF